MERARRLFQRFPQQYSTSKNSNIEYQASIKDIKKTLSLEPRHFKAISGLGFIYMKLGQWEEALEAFVKISQIYPRFQGLEQYITRLKKKVSFHRV